MFCLRSYSKHEEVRIILHYVFYTSQIIYVINLDGNLDTLSGPDS